MLSSEDITLILVAMQTLTFAITAVFIAIQTQRISKTLNLNMHQDVLNNLHRLDELLISNSDLSNVFDERKNRLRPKDRTFLYFVFNLLDSLYSKFRIGIVDYHTWEPWRNWLTHTISKKHVRGFWVSIRERNVYTAAFSDLVDGYTERNDSPISIVIPFNGDTEDLIRCIAAIRATQNNSYPIFVISDGADTQEASRILGANPPGVSFIQIRHAGPSAARNKGLELVKSEYVAFIDPDITVGNDTIQTLYDEITADQRVAGVQSLPISSNTHNTISLVEEAQYWLNYVSTTDSTFDSNQIHSHCVVFRRNVLWDIGGFDRSFTTPGGEDTELSFRLRQHGFSLRISNSAIVSHKNTTTLTSYISKRYSRVKARAKLYLIHPSKMFFDKNILGSFLLCSSTIVSLYIASVWPVAVLLALRYVFYSVRLLKLNREPCHPIVITLVSLVCDFVYFSFPYHYFREFARRIKYGV